MTKPSKRQSLPFYPLATQGFRNVWNAPRVVIPPPPRTFRKYCAQSEKTATSPSCKQITQPSGAATPRDSDAHHAHRCPEGFLRSSRAPPGQDPKAAKYAVLTPGHAGFPKRVKRSEGSDTTPVRNTPVSPCELLCTIFLRKPSVYPLLPAEANVRRLCRRC